MTPEEFVKGFYLERSSLIDFYFNKESRTDVSELISSMCLDAEGKDKLKELLSSVLRDAFYTILLGLDGEAQIGGRQETYTLTDEKGNILSGGEIESYAWEYFHNNRLDSGTES